MTQGERRLFLIKELLAEDKRYKNTPIPQTSTEQKRLLRALFNVRMPSRASEEFIKIQDEYLKAEIEKAGVTDYRDLSPIENGIYLWQGDITTLKCDAIVNAANSQMLGCFCPNHNCIDNAIHTFSGVQLRLKMAQIMNGRAEKTGGAIISPAYNLPCKYVIHTVGPIVNGAPDKNDFRLLESCYRSCLTLADKHKLKSIAFCCISTGEFCFPNEAACDTAISTVKKYKTETGSKIEVIFNVFKDRDYELYSERLKGN